MGSGGSRAGGADGLVERLDSIEGVINGLRQVGGGGGAYFGLCGGEPRCDAGGGLAEAKLHFAKLSVAADWGGGPRVQQGRSDPVCDRAASYGGAPAVCRRESAARVDCNPPAGNRASSDAASNGNEPAGIHAGYGGGNDHQPTGNDRSCASANCNGSPGSHADGNERSHAASNGSEPAGIHAGSGGSNDHQPTKNDHSRASNSGRSDDQQPAGNDRSHAASDCDGPRAGPGASNDHHQTAGNHSSHASSGDCNRASPGGSNGHEPVGNERGGCEQGDDSPPLLGCNIATDDADVLSRSILLRGDQSRRDRKLTNVMFEEKAAGGQEAAGVPQTSQKQDLSTTAGETVRARLAAAKAERQCLVQPFLHMHRTPPPLDEARSSVVACLAVAFSHAVGSAAWHRGAGPGPDGLRGHAAVKAAFPETGCEWDDPAAAGSAQLPVSPECLAGALRLPLRHVALDSTTMGEACGMADAFSRWVNGLGLWGESRPQIQATRLSVLGAAGGPCVQPTGRTQGDGQGLDLGGFCGALMEGLQEAGTTFLVAYHPEVIEKCLTGDSDDEASDGGGGEGSCRLLLPPGAGGGDEEEGKDIHRMPSVNGKPAAAAAGSSFALVTGYNNALHKVQLSHAYIAASGVRVFQHGAPAGAIYDSMQRLASDRATLLK
eukprot:gene10607-16323_t